MFNPYRMVLPARSWKNMTAIAVLFAMWLDFQTHEGIVQEIATGTCYSVFQGWLVGAMFRISYFVLSWTLFACVWPLIVCVARLWRTAELNGSEPGWTTGQMLKVGYTMINKAFCCYSEGMSNGNPKYIAGTALMLLAAYGASALPVFAYIMIIALLAGVISFFFSMFKILYHMR